MSVNLPACDNDIPLGMLMKDPITKIIYEATESGWVKVKDPEFRRIDIDELHYEEVLDEGASHMIPNREMASRVAPVEVEYEPIPEKEKKKRGRPCKPKRNTRPPTDYNLFIQRVLPVLKSVEPDLTNKECLQQVSKYWSAFDQNRTYKGMAERDNYRRELEDLDVYALLGRSAPNE